MNLKKKEKENNKQAKIQRRLRPCYFISSATTAKQLMETVINK